MPSTCSKLHHGYAGQRTCILEVHHRQELATAVAPTFRDDTAVIDHVLLLIIENNERRIDDGKSKGDQKVQHTQFSYRQTCAVPCFMRLKWVENFNHRTDHLVAKFFWQAACDASDSFCGGPSNVTTWIPHRLQQLFDDLFNFRRHFDIIIVLFCNKQMKVQDIFIENRAKCSHYRL